MSVSGHGHGHVSVHVFVHVFVFVYMYMYMFMYIYMYMYVHVYVYVCLHMCMECVWKDGERTVSRAKSGETIVEASKERKTRKSFVKPVFMGAKDKSNHLTGGSLQRFPTITVA